MFIIATNKPRIYAGVISNNRGSTAILPGWARLDNDASTNRTFGTIIVRTFKIPRTIKYTRHFLLMYGV